MTRRRTAIVALALSALISVTDLIPSTEAMTIQQKRPAAEPQTSCGARGAPPKEPLLAAAYRGDVAAIKRLLAGGTDINLKNKNGDDALILAADYGHGEAIKILLEKGADVNAKYLGTESVLKLAGKNQEIINLLRAHGAK